MKQYLTARAEEVEQGNVHVDESEDVMKVEEEDLDEIISEVREDFHLLCSMTKLKEHSREIC